MNRDEFNRKVRTSQEQFIETLRQVPASEAEQPILPGNWSVKDMVAHVTYWQALINRQVQAVLRGLNPEHGPQSRQDVDESNRQAALESQSKTYEEVLHDFELGCVNLSNTLELLSAQDLFEDGRFREIDGEPLWKSIAVETYEHFEEHIHDLSRWGVQAG